MATYNGAKFIEEQIDSIINQSYKNWELIIHDDGSKDSTIEIVRKLCRKDKRICLIEDNIVFGNAAENFMHLVQIVDGDLFMFADQDDIWYSDKIENMLNYMNQGRLKNPKVVFSAAMVWDGKKELYIQRNLPIGTKSILFSNCGIQGASSMFNKEILLLLKRWKGPLSMHDHLLTLLACFCGELSYCPEVLMKYRKHPNAVTIKARSNNILLNLIRGRKENVIDTCHFKTICNFYKIYNNVISENDKRLIRDFIKMPEESFLCRCLTIVRNKFNIHNSTLLLLFKICIRSFCKKDLKKTKI